MIMDIEQIRAHLPHRYPCLLVDRVIALVPGESIEAYKNLSINEPFFDGHFPHPARFSRGVIGRGDGASGRDSRF